MKNTKLFGWAFIAAMLGTGFSACTNEAEEVMSQESEIKLTSEITRSRVTSNLQSEQLEEGRSIGVTITGSKSGDDYVNKVWTSDGEGGLSTEHTVYWANTDIDVVAYHPYNEGWASGSQTFTVSSDQSVEANYLNSDLLFASKPDVAKTENAISLEFDHKLAKVNVTLLPEYDTDAERTKLNDAIITICNVKPSTTIDLSNGQVSTEATGEVQEIKAGVGLTASAIVAPQTIVASTKFIKVQLGEKTFYYTLPAEKVLTSGYSHNYTLTVKETAVKIANSSVINNWTPDNDEGNTGDANEDRSILTVSLAQAGTLGNYLTENKKDIVEKLKIIGDINGTDIQLLRDFAVCDNGARPIEGTTGALVFLDLSEANIVSGGNAYNGHIKTVNTEDNVITDEMFEYTNFSNIILPKTITKIGHSAFEAMRSLTSLIIPQGVTIIGQQAFNTNIGLTNISIPETVVEIGAEAFISCENLKSVTIPSKVTLIEDYTFNNCYDLESVTLPSGITEIGIGAFQGCTSLTEFHCKALNPPTIDSSTFSSATQTDCTLYVPTGKKAAYKAADYWKDFTNIEEE